MSIFPTLLGRQNVSFYKVTIKIQPKHFFESYFPVQQTFKHGTDTFPHSWKKEHRQHVNLSGISGKMKKKIWNELGDFFWNNGGGATPKK